MKRKDCKHAKPFTCGTTAVIGSFQPGPFLHWYPWHQSCDCGWNPWEGLKCKSNVTISALNSLERYNVSPYSQVCFCVQSDFLLVVLRDVVQAYPDVRIILMSATIDTTMFREYFFNCPVIEVHGRAHAVQGEKHVFTMHCFIMIF